MKKIFSRSSRSSIVAVILIALMLSGCQDGVNNNYTATQQTQNYEAQEDLIKDMRKLWSDHVIWTRDYIIAAVAGTPDAQYAAVRLIKNQEDIGNAVATYYGTTAGNKLTELLKQHINIAVDLIAAAKAKDTAKLKDNDTKWKQNGREIADFLSAANPNNWPQATLRDMMNKHLATTADELNARLNQKYDDDVKAFDAVFDHILMMSDALAEGIIKQFPDKF